MREAAAAGALDVQNGDLMLVTQSAAAFELWTGQKPSTDLLFERLEAAREGEGSAGPAPAVEAAATEA
jgi:shikimate 5-dehydrogenase